MTKETLVIFRKFKPVHGGDIIAIFPEMNPSVSAYSRSDVTSYMHVGQHGAATYSVLLYNCVLATPEEYDSLRQELESIGYVLKIRKKWIRRD